MKNIPRKTATIRCLLAAATITLHLVVVADSIDMFLKFVTPALEVATPLSEQAESPPLFPTIISHERPLFLPSRSLNQKDSNNALLFWQFQITREATTWPESMPSTPITLDWSTLSKQAQSPPFPPTTLFNCFKSGSRKHKFLQFNSSDCSISPLNTPNRDCSISPLNDQSSYFEQQQAQFGALLNRARATTSSSTDTNLPPRLLSNNKTTNNGDLLSPSSPNHDDPTVPSSPNDDDLTPPLPLFPSMTVLTLSSSSPNDDDLTPPSSFSQTTVLVKLSLFPFKGTPATRPSAVLFNPTAPKHNNSCLCQRQLVLPQLLLLLLSNTIIMSGLQTPLSLAGQAAADAQAAAQAATATQAAAAAQAAATTISTADFMKFLQAYKAPTR
jgi:hypothetical protein